jgi:hypothetical protein
VLFRSADSNGALDVKSVVTSGILVKAMNNSRARVKLLKIQ